MKRLIVPILIWFFYALSGYVIVHIGYDNLLHGFLSWNSVLSLIALIFAQLVKGKTWLNGLFLVGWFFMLPNAFYMITDLIHINSSWFYTTIPNVSYKMIGMPWLRLVHLFIGVYLSVYWGLLSMRQVYRWLRERLSVYWVEAIFVLISLANGVGIFLGRFIRLNSWDMLNPSLVFEALFKSADLFSFKFILLFSGMIYFLFQLFQWHNRTEIKEANDES